MASIYRNGNLFWLKGRDLRTGAPLRFSLGTASAAQAALHLRKWEAWSALFAPDFSNEAWPEQMQEFLTALPTGFAALLPVLAPVDGADFGEKRWAKAMAMTVMPEKPLKTVLQKYLR